MSLFDGLLAKTLNRESKIVISHCDTMEQLAPLNLNRAAHSDLLPISVARTKNGYGSPRYHLGSR
jgi:hypothetical protein